MSVFIYTLSRLIFGELDGGGDISICVELLVEGTPYILYEGKATWNDIVYMQEQLTDISINIEKNNFLRECGITELSIKSKGTIFLNVILKKPS
jgi:hypothetical protein